MTIWLPEHVYRAVPLVCIVLGAVFLLTAPGLMSVALSITLIGYAAVVLMSRRVWSGVTTAS